MQQPKLYRLALLTVCSILLYHGIVASPARAGGGDPPDSATTTANCATEPSADANGNTSNATVNRKCQPKPRTFDWQYWSQPTSQGQDLCREHLNGNTVCLTSASAAEFHW